MKEVLASIKCDNLEMKQLITLCKKQQTTDDKSDVMPKPLEIDLPDEQAKHLILQQARILRFTKHTKVFIVSDMTPADRVNRRG